MAAGRGLIRRLGSSSHATAAPAGTAARSPSGNLRNANGIRSWLLQPLITEFHGKIWQICVGAAWKLQLRLVRISPAGGRADLEIVTFARAQQDRIVVV